MQKGIKHTTKHKNVWLFFGVHTSGASTQYTKYDGNKFNNYISVVQNAGRCVCVCVLGGQHSV